MTIVAIVAAGLAAPALASDPAPGPSYVVPVFDTDERPAASYVVPAPSPSDRRAFTPGAYNSLAKAPPMIAAPFSWTGCYIGVHVGGAVSGDSTSSSFGNSTTFSSTGVVGGGQIGCDYQFGPRWVAGLEGRAAAVSLKTGHATTVTNLVTGVTIPAQFTLSNDSLESATARLGYRFADRWLVFARGGGAWTHEKADDAFTTVRGVAVDPNATLNRAGWTVGTGVDWAFAPHWSATLEYNYYDFGSKGVTLLDTPKNVFVSGLSWKDTIHAVTTGVNYHF